MNVIAFSEGLVRSARNLPHTLATWGDVDEELREHYAGAILEQITSFHAAASAASKSEILGLSASWSVFVQTVVRYATPLREAIGFDVLKLLLPTSVGHHRMRAYQIAKKKVPAFLGWADKNSKPATLKFDVEESQMTMPKLTEVFAEAPDWKKSFKAAKKADAAAGHPLAVGSLEVPKAPKPAPTAKPIRKGGPDNDPLKTATTGEVFETEAGTYFVFRGINQKYYAVFVDGNVQRAKDLGEHPSRKEAIDAVLADHDKTAAGIGEIRFFPMTQSLMEMFLYENQSDTNMKQLQSMLARDPYNKTNLAVYSDALQEANSPLADFILFVMQHGQEFMKIFDGIRKNIDEFERKINEFLPGEASKNTLVKQRLNFWRNKVKICEKSFADAVSTFPDSEDPLINVKFLAGDLDDLISYGDYKLRFGKNDQDKYDVVVGKDGHYSGLDDMGVDSSQFDTRLFQPQTHAEMTLLYHGLKKIAPGDD